MMPHKRMFLTFLIADIALFIAYQLSKWILGLNNLAYRNVVNYSVYAAQVIITLVVGSFVTVFLFRRARMKEEKSAVRIISGAGIATIVIITAVASLNLFIRGVFGHQPEHRVEKDGRIMLARVDSFLQVEVRYYDYVNALVRGSSTLIHEDYGNGGYDPFEWDTMPEVHRYIYYDENGEIIKSNWFDSYSVSSSPSGGSDAAQGEPVGINKLDISVMENRENELVFTISMDDFISTYNELSPSRFCGQRNASKSGMNHRITQTC